MENLGRVLVAVGLAITLLGAALWLGKGQPWLRIGRLPGDIVVERPGFRFYFPIVTMIVVSLVLTGLTWIVGMFRK